MDNKFELYDIADKLSDTDCEKLETAFENFRDGAEIGDEQKQRILSLALRKAGIDMTTGIKMKRTPDIEQADTIHEGMSTVRRGRTLVACIAAVLVAAAAGAAVFFTKLPTSDIEPPAENLTAAHQTAETVETAEVPNVVLMDADEAKAALEAAGFVPIRREQFDETAAGLVIDTYPQHGENLEKGSEVVYYVSRGSFDTADPTTKELYEYAMDLYSQTLDFHGETLADFNKENGTDIALPRPFENMEKDQLEYLCGEYKEFLGMTYDEYYDYLRGLCVMTVDSSYTDEESVTTVTAETPEELPDTE